MAISINTRQELRDLISELKQLQFSNLRQLTMSEVRAKKLIQKVLEEDE